ncbi:MAG: ferrous iron transporter B, partial [Candidatus Methanomethylophilaceae archaeon]|nr:ferrous iron transporter B [Candidatus Methanomethylophilaceae archaeon]
DNILVYIARDRYGDAHVITLSVVEKSEKKQTLGERVSDMIISPATGIPILVAVLLATFSILIFFGGFLADLIEHAYTEIVGTAIIDFGKSIGGGLGEAIFTGIDSSISAILGLVIPYIMVFYIVLGVLEDSGYLPRAVVLLDTTLHRIGLHGNAFIPMMVGLGCNVPAVLATRSVRSHRERLILCTIICMAVPCSAQLATIAGVTGNFAGAGWALAILAILVILGFTIGCVLNRRLRFEPSNLAMELPALQMPSLKGTLKKTWMRTSDFFKLAVPLLIVGSIVVQLLIHYGFLDLLVDPMSWLTSGLLGLPAITIIAFMVGLVCKEMSYGMLVVLAASQGITDMSQFMTPAQYVVFGLVMAVYVPCLSTIVALHKEMGVRDTAIIFVSAILVAIVLGSVFNLILPFVM